MMKKSDVGPSGRTQTATEEVNPIVFDTVKENEGRGMADVESHLGFTIANVCVSQQYHTSVAVMFSVRPKASELQRGKDGDTQVSLLWSQS